MTGLHAADPFCKLQLAVPLSDIDVRPGGAAVPEAGSGMAKEAAFAQIVIEPWTCEILGKDA